MAKIRRSTKAFAAAAAGAGTEAYILRLYVAGTAPASTRAVEALRAVCDRHLIGRYRLEVVDVFQQASLARDEQIIAIPTLVKRAPLPERRMLGNLSDEESILAALGLRPKAE